MQRYTTQGVSIFACISGIMISSAVGSAPEKVIIVISSMFLLQKTKLKDCSIFRSKCLLHCQVRFCVVLYETFWCGEDSKCG